MRGLIRVAAFCAALGGAGEGLAQTARPDRLQGELLLGGATLVDPPPDEPRDSHAYFAVTGAAARRLYEAMRGAARAEGCEAGQRLRRQGHLTCTIGSRRQDANCSFAIDLRNGAMAPGLPC